MPRNIVMTSIRSSAAGGLFLCAFAVTLSVVGAGAQAPLAPPLAAAPKLEQELRTEVNRFVEADRLAPPASCQVLFVGSSSIVKWRETLAADMAPMPVINRGFGGSHIEHVNRWFDQIVAPYRPRAIVFYAGENDIDAGKSVQRIVADFAKFMAHKTRALGNTPVYFIALKPSKLRFAQFTLQRQVNSAIRARSNQRADLHFIDVVSPMLENGKPKNIFEPDDLHMTRAGYLIWARAVKDALLPDSDSELKECKQGAVSQSHPPQVDADGTIHVPPFSLPESSLLNAETIVALKTIRERDKEETASPDDCPSMESADRVQLPAIRRCEADAFYRSMLYKRLREQYPVAITPQEIGGVYTEVFTPRDGLAPKNKNRVLINLHGGHFKGGSRVMSHLESIPITSIGKIKVVSVDYRMAPEYAFPAASEDVAAVYRELLKTYKPKNIGIYGSSAGGLLTAESIAGFQKEGLPLPAAVGMLAGGASYYQEGDSGPLSAAMTWASEMSMINRREFTLSRLAESA
jgi:hypothetical protein